jgi:hypothetical protein
MNTFVAAAARKAFAVMTKDNMPDGQGIYPEKPAAGQQKA